MPVVKPYPLELSRTDMEQMLELAGERIVRFIEGLPEDPATDIDPSYTLARSLSESAPELGTRFEELLGVIFDRAVGDGFNNPGPGFMAYIPGGGLFHAAIGDLIADCINRYATVWMAAPSLVQLEVNVIRWFCDMVGYPASAGGFLSSGGSMSNFTALFTARRERLPENFLAGTLYASSQTHHSIERAARLAGFPADAVRIVPVDDRFRIRTDALAERIAEDRTAGREPFLIAGSIGTTNTGAVDDLEELADLAERERLWLHLDGAYGGFFALTERGRALMHGVERADSITLDPHKSLFLPYGTGCILMRDGKTLERAHSIHADYMPAMSDTSGGVDFCNLSPELSREFRGLRVWLPIKMHGLGVFRDALDEKLDLTDWAHAALQSIDGIEIVAEPQLSVVAFRLDLDGHDADELNELNRDLLERINDRRRVFLTGTILDGRFSLRICVLNFRTHLDRMEACLDDVRSAVEEIRACRASLP